MKLHEYLLGFVIFTAVVSMGVGILVDVNEHYDTNISTTEYKEFNQTGEAYNLSKEMYDQTLEGDISEDESWESMSKGAYSGARLVKNSPTMFFSIIESIATYLKIPSFFVVLAGIALIISIVFAIIYLIRGFKP